MYVEATGGDVQLADAFVGRPRGGGDPIQGFEFYLRREREASGATCRIYVYWVKRWQAWCSVNNVPMMHPTPLDIRTFSTSEQWERKTRSQLLSSIKAFYRYCVLDGFMPYSPAEVISGPRLFRTRGPQYRRHEARRLLEATNDVYEKLVVGLGLFAGVRSGEGLALEPNDVDFANGVLHIRRTYGEPTTKGKRAREIPLHSWLRDPLRTAVRIADDRLFDFAEEAYRKRHKRVAERAGLPYHKPHALRRTFSTTLTQNGVRDGVVRQLMGHAATVTDLYVDIFAHELRGAIRGLRY